MFLPSKNINKLDILTFILTLIFAHELKPLLISYKFFNVSFVYELKNSLV